MSQSAGDSFERLASRLELEAPAELEPRPRTIQRRRCSSIARAGGRCKAWAIVGGELCAAHAGIVRPSPEKASKANVEAAKRRRLERQSFRDRAASELENDSAAVLEALRAGVREGSAAARARAAIAWVQLVYGRQLQQSKDEAPSQELELSSEQRASLIAELAELEPELAERLGVAPSSSSSAVA